MNLAVAVLVLLVPSPAAAYLDPGSGSILAQVLLGGVAGLAVILRLCWGRLTARVRRILDRPSRGAAESKGADRPPDPA
jgi:hypothetical protein